MHLAHPHREAVQRVERDLLPAELPARLPRLGEAVPAEGSLTIEVLDVDGTVLRRYSSEETDQDRCRLDNQDPRRPLTIDYPATDAGLQRWHWDLHRDDVRCTDDHILFEGYGGPPVAPGRYTVRVSAGEASATAALTVPQSPVIIPQAVSPG